MGSLTKNLSWSEVLRGSGYDDDEPATHEVLSVMEDAAIRGFQVLRDAWGDSLNIVAGGGLRSPDMNKRVGGSKKSRHVVGDAFDLKLPSRRDNRDYLDLYRLIDAMQRDGRLPKGGLGLYWSSKGKVRFIHFDTRGRIARWNASHKKKAFAYYSPEATA